MGDRIPVGDQLCAVVVRVGDDRHGPGGIDRDRRVALQLAGYHQLGQPDRLARDDVGVDDRQGCRLEEFVRRLRRVARRPQNDRVARAIRGQAPEKAFGAGWCDEPGRAETAVVDGGELDVELSAGVSRPSQQPALRPGLDEAQP